MIRTRMSIVLILAVLPIGCGGGGGANGGGGGDGDGGGDVAEAKEWHLERLRGLGVNTEPASRLAPNGEPVRDDHNPLGRGVCTMARVPELYIGGVRLSSPYGEHPSHETEHLIDDLDLIGNWGGSEYRKGFRPPKNLLSSGGPDWSQWYGASPEYFTLNADLDGDGLEELLLAISGPAGHEMRMIKPDRDEDSGIVRYRREAIQVGTGQHIIDLEAGDIDGDGKDEIVFLWQDGQSEVRLSVLDDEDESFGVLRIENLGFPASDVALADLDQDGAAEFVLVSQWGGSYHVYDDLRDGQFDALADGTLPDPGSQRVAIGDFDGDNLLEIAVHSLQVSASPVGPFGTGRGITRFIDDYLGGVDEPGIDAYGLLSVTHSERAIGVSLFPTGVPPFAAFNLDGTGSDELLIGGDIIRIETIDDETGDWGIELINNTEHLLYAGGGVLPRKFGMSRHNVAVGNFDADDAHGEEIALILGAGDSPQVAFFGLVGTTVRLRRTISIESPSGLGQPVQVTIAAANVDTDSVVLRYRDEHELLFTDPIVVAVLASPPYHGDGSQDTSDMETTYTVSTGRSYESGGSVGVSVGFSVGIEVDMPLAGSAAGKVEATVGVEASLDVSYTVSRTVIKETEYSAEAGTDLVIFTATPYDVYYYTILVAENSEDVGKQATISVPRGEVRTYRATRTFYNEHNGTGVVIDDSVMSHTIGDPGSYPHFDDQLDDVWIESDFATLSNTGQPLTLTASLETGKEIGVEGMVEVSIDASVGATVIFGKSAKFRLGYHYSHNWLEGWGVSGTVRDPEGSSLSNSYDWKVLLREVSRGDHAFHVVSYQVR